MTKIPCDTPIQSKDKKEHVPKKDGRSKLSPAHKAYLKTLIKRTLTMKNTML